MLIYHILFLQSVVDWHIGCFHHLFVINSINTNTTIHMCLVGFLCDRLYSNYFFNFLNNWQTVFHHGYTILHALQPCKRILVPPHSFQHLFSFKKKPILVTVLMGMKYYLVLSCVVLICNPLVTNSINYIFMCLLAIYCIFLEKKNTSSSPFKFFRWRSVFWVVRVKKNSECQTVRYLPWKYCLLLRRLSARFCDSNSLM